MIVKMKKYSMMIFHREFDDFLTALQDRGVLDLVRREHLLPAEGSARMDEVKRIDQLMAFLSEWATKNNLKQVPTSRTVDAEFLHKVERLRQEREDVLATLKRYDKEHNEVAAWGVYSTKMIEDLSRQGIVFRYFSCPKGKVKKNWFQDYSLSLMAELDGIAYLVAVGQSGEEAELPSVLKEEKVPQTTLVLRSKEQKELQQQLKRVEKEIGGISQQIDVFKKAKFELLDEFEFQVASVSAEREMDNRVMIVEGWCPETLQEDLNKFLEDQGVMCVIQEVDPQDSQVPILLKNNKFASLFEPITRLFSLPKYAELDPTPFFAPFYMLFFGFCFGDGGYGLLFVLLGFVLKRLLPKNTHGIITLSQLLGSAAVFFGILTGTVFGVSITDLQIPALVTYKKYALSQDGLMKLSLALGGFQILFAMLVNVINTSIQKGFKYAIGTLSWLVLFISSLVQFGLPQIGVQLPLGIQYGVLTCLASAVLGIFFYNSPEHNVFMNFGMGLWNTYNMATGILGDMLSYIRLFALGLTGGILGGVFNNLAFTMTGDIPVLSTVFTLLILLFGHTLNIGLSALGALVHPLRLTFVEFYKNSGFEGGGRAYKPFVKETK